MIQKLTPTEWCPAMITGTLRHLSRLLIAAVVFSGHGQSVCAQDDSQRPLPFPAKETADPGVHLELLKRLRSTITEAQQEASSADSSAAADSPNVANPMPPEAPRSTPSESQPAAGKDGPSPSPSPSALRQLGDLLKNLKDQLPEGMIPPALDQLPAEDLKKGLRAPETQQKLRELLQQFRQDGMLPPETEQEVTGEPLPVPPSETNKAVPRSSLKALDEFLQKLQQKSAAPDDESVEPSGHAEQSMPPNTEPQTRNKPRQPMRRRDSAPGSRSSSAPDAQPAPVPPGNPSAPNVPDSAGPPTASPRDRKPPATPLQPGSSTTPGSSAAPRDTPPRQSRPDSAGPSGGLPGASSPADSRKNESSNSDSRKQESSQGRPQTTPPDVPEAASPSDTNGTPAPQLPELSSGQNRNPRATPPEAGRNPIRFRPQPGPASSSEGELPPAEAGAAGSKSTPENQGPSATGSAMDSLQKLMREMSQQLSGGSGQSDRNTLEGSSQPADSGMTPRAEQAAGSAAGPAPAASSGTRPQNSGNAARQEPGTGPARRNSSQPPSTELGGRADTRGNRDESASAKNSADRGQQPRNADPSQKTPAAPFSVEQFLKEQLQDPALRSAAASPETQQLLEQIMGQSGTAPDSLIRGKSDPGIGQRGEGPPDPNSSPRSNHLLPRPQDARAGTPDASSPEQFNTQRSGNKSGGAGNAADGPRRQSEDVAQQLQKRGFAGTLRQIVEEARRETEQQRQRQEEDALAQSQAKSAAPSESAAGPVDSQNSEGTTSPREPSSSAWQGPERAGDRKPFDAKSALEMLDSFSEKMQRQTEQSRGNSDQELSRDRGFGSEPGAQQSGSALDRMRDLAGGLLSDKPAANVPSPAAPQNSAVSLMPPGSLSAFDWTPALILGGILATLMLLIPAARVIQRRTGQQPELRNSEFPLAAHEIRTRQDIVRAFHQLAKRCSRSVRPWWNHLQLATELSRVIPDRQQTVSELAAVYERARYQPVDHELTPAELSAAQLAIRRCATTPG